MQKFDWNKFKTEKIAVHCKTEEEAKDFCREMHEQGMKWSCGASYLKYTNYDVYPEKICYYADGEHSSLKFAYEHSFTILEWSDYMQKEFTKADLKDGMVVEERKGVMGFVLKDRILYEDGWDILASWEEDLTNNINDNFDIIKVYKIKMENVFELSDILSIKNLELIWGCNGTKRMTVEEMRQKLEELTGEKIEVEPSREEMVGVLTKHCSKYDDCNLCCIRKECEKNGKLDFWDYSTEMLKQCYEKVMEDGRKV